MALRGGGGANRQLSCDSDHYHPPKRRIQYTDDFDDHHVSDRESLPPDSKRFRSAPGDYNVPVPFLTQLRPSPGPDLLLEPNYSRRTSTPVTSEREHSAQHWLPSSRFSPDPDLDSGSDVGTFWVRRGGEHADPVPPPSSDTVSERTASGLTISSDVVGLSASTELIEDDEAANRVREHMVNFRRRNPDSKHERILRSIIYPRSMATEYPLDDASLQSIFSAANEIFFNGRLSQRVKWDWSHESSAQYDCRVIGTTALRRASRRGFETLIVLSKPILKDSRYSRRLLISTFMHELVHSYLFICCGFRARHCGGHTPGFRAIAKMMDDWAGPDSQLYLNKMEANLERFRLKEGRSPSPPDHSGHRHRDVIYPCSGLEESEHSIAYGPGPDSGPEYCNNADPWWGYNRVNRPLHPGPRAFGNDPSPTYVFTDRLPQTPYRVSSEQRLSPRY